MSSGFQGLGLSGKGWPEMTSEPPENGILVGRMGRPFGVRGFGRVKVLSDNPDRFVKDNGQTFLLLPSARLSGRSRRLELEEIAFKGDALLLKWKGVDSPEFLREMSGWEIHWEGPDDWVPQEPGEFLISDLVGMQVIDCESGRIVGKIFDFYERPGQDLLAIDAEGREVLCPFVEPLVPRIDRDKREVHVQWNIVGT